MKLVSACLLTVLLTVSPAYAQASQPTVPSPRKAFALSLVLPGLGHYHANGGHWRGNATAFALIDVVLMTSTVSAVIREQHRIDSYEALAVSQAQAQIEGKDRTFFLNLASFRSSDAYLDTQLRNRSWDQVDYVSDPAFQWAWQSENAFTQFRDLREEAESLDRRRSLLIATLVANRLISGIIAARKAGRESRASTPDLALALHPTPVANNRPMLHLSLRF